MDLTLDELLDKIRNIFYLSYKEKCDKCKYHLFSKKLKKMDISSDVLKVVLKEIMEDVSDTFNRETYNKFYWKI